MSTITDIATIGVPVSDQEAARAFFIDKLGFEERTDFRLGDGFRWLTVAPRGAAITVALISRRDEIGRDTGIRFSVESADDEHQRLTELGVPAGEVLRWPGVPAMFDFRDPDGNLYEIVESR